MFGSSGWRTAFSLGVVIAGLGFASSAIGAAGGGTPTSGTVYLGQAPKPGSVVYDAGFIYDKVLGQGAVTFVTKPLVSAMERSRSSRNL